MRRAQEGDERRRGVSVEHGLVAVEQECGVPVGYGVEVAVWAESAVGGEQVQVGVPLREVPSGGEGDHETRADGAPARAANELDRRLGPGPGEIDKEGMPTTE